MTSAEANGRWSVIALVTALVATFLAIAGIGAREAARNERVLAWLDPVMVPVHTHGWQSIHWLLARHDDLGWTITAIAAAIALIGLAVGRMRALPLIVLAAAIALAAWGQILLLADQVRLGIYAYAGGITGAAVLGIWCPLTRVGFPALPLPSGGERDSPAPFVAWRPHWRRECLIVFGLTFAAILTRIYALTELPQGVDFEMIDSMILSRTVYGLREYMRYPFLNNSTGVVHLFPKTVLFPLFGTSIYTLRLAAVFFSVLAVPLAYWLVRRMAGVGPAIAAAVLLIVAPEQLYWARMEDTHFIAIGPLVLISLHLGLWLVERFGFWAALGAALWMPVCRYFYAPGYVMFTYPLLLAAHALVCVRGAWRKSWYVVPVLAGGLALWVCSLSIVYWYLNDYHWTFMNPAMVFGAPAWRHHGTAGFREAGFLELAQLQSAVMLNNLRAVMSGLAYNEPGMLSQFYLRGCVLPNHVTVTNAGFTVMLALGFGYLLAQITERRAFALLVCVAIGLLPALMSDDPATRRFAVIFPAANAMAALMLGATVRIVHARAGRWLAWITTGVIAIAVAVVAWTSLAAHLNVPTGQAYFQAQIRFAKPLFSNSDLILHNLEQGIAKPVLLGNLDEFLTLHPCYHHIEDKAWLAAALHPTCDFNEFPYQATMAPEAREALQRAFHPQRISFLLHETPYSVPQIALLRQLFPAAEMRRDASAVDARTLVSMTVSAADIEALRAPELVAPNARALATRLLDGVMLNPAAAPEGEAPPIVVRGGLSLERDGWYRFAVEPACPAATLSVDQRSANADTQPLLAGVHPFELTLPSAAACQLPLRVATQSDERGETTALSAAALVSPAVAALPQAQAPVVLPYAGYGEANVFPRLTGGPMDFDVDAGGRLSILIQDQGAWRMQRFAADGHEETRWPVSVPPQGFSAMAVDANGTSILVFEHLVRVYSAAGEQIGAWEAPWVAGASDLTLWPDGRLLLTVPTRDAVSVFSRDGHLQGELKQFAGGPGQLHLPAAVALGAAGDMAVTQDDGQVLLFHHSGDPLTATFAGSFRVALSILPFGARAAFDGDRVLVTDPTTPPLIYSSQGQRLMAARADRDLSTRGVGPATRLRVADDRLYVLNRQDNKLSIVQR